ncbi:MULTISPECIES: helix-turn-helix domain-containing protein [Providencia]|uniref:helix-turn-helix domain-containing protein n=1 Tax=Providencia TaxID=586 RepID=UPI0008381A19|nr:MULTISPECIES: helix-turn-helix domain-containing protein [Providencia]MBP6122057.1 helix-turn-helix domain-containing protein [Providencia sp.]NIH24160.1 helix-turn-helix domain-containing protein [Providencia heimbachae]QCJ71546.1 transposase [Providencia heimbachae]
MDNYILRKNIVEDILSWIDNNTDKSLTIEQISDKAGYSKWHFQRIFKSIVGVSLGQYLLIRRLLKVSSDLKDTDDKIIDIAFRYGFDSQQELTRAFKRKLKITPGKYRKEYVLEANFN